MSRKATRTGPLFAAITFVSAAWAGDPSEVGQWMPPTKWEVIAIHAAVLPTGKVLYWSYPAGTEGSRSMVWDPQTEQFSPVDMSTDIFCSGLTVLPNGFLYVTGGNDYACHFQGRLNTFVFDPFSELWSPLGDMVDRRWYPTNARLGDGSVLILSGLNTVCETNPFMERYVPGVGLSLVPGGERLLSLFPRTHLLTTGALAHVGPESWTYTFNPAAGNWAPVAPSNLGWRCEGTSVLIPGRTDQVLIVGGNCPVTSTAEIIDFASPAPQWQWTTPMTFARAHADALILPDATVMIVGGGTEEQYGSPVLVPELFDPVTETWQSLPPHTYGRMYHATTVLLPDGRVLLAGQDSGLSSYSGEIYQPAYLFRGPRPQILAAPDRIAYDRAFSLNVPQAEGIKTVALVAPSTVTHSVNFTQRYVGMTFQTIGPGALTVTGPPNGNHAPPGYYMLFALDVDDVPSVAEFVHLGAWRLGDIDGDGVTGIADFLSVLANWGPCPGCNADVDGDGVVGILDVLDLLANWSG